MKKLLIAALLASAVFTSAQAEPLAGRMWENINFTAVLSPEWAFMVMPGHRWEFSRDNGATKDTYFEDLFAGPIFTLKLDDSLKLKIPVWYYYMGFPTRSNNTYVFSHNLEILPILEWKVDPKMTLVSRSIFHNTFFASRYLTEAQQNGWSTLLRQMIQVNYAIDSNLSVFAGDELFIGLITDNEAAPVYGPGFVPSGIVENRVIAGFTYKLTPEISIVPQYVYSTNYNYSPAVNGAAEGSIKENQHNFYLTVNYTLKCFGSPAPAAAAPAPAVAPVAAPAPAPAAAPVAEPAAVPAPAPATPAVEQPK